VGPRLITEFVGTFIFLTVIALSANAGVLAPLAIGLALMAMVYMGGHVSGAHYNPAVSLGLFLRRVIPAPTMAMYWLVQLVAGLLAFSLAFAWTGRHAALHPGTGVSAVAALTAEVVFTAALVLVVLNVAATRETAGNSFYGLAIGLTVAAGAFVTGPISGAAFNPAVGVAATFSGAVFGQDSWSDLWIYVVGPLLGAAIGAGIHWLQARPGPVPVEESERSAS
jgi:aquaporin Z